MKVAKVRQFIDDYDAPILMALYVWGVVAAILALRYFLGDCP